jgi:AAA domain/UvrD-like helicase C-terminal domain
VEAGIEAQLIDVSTRSADDKLVAYLKEQSIYSVEQLAQFFSLCSILEEENKRLEAEHEYICGELMDATCEKIPVLEYLDSTVALTSDQREGLSDLELFLRGNDLLSRIQGYAGTGKSFLVCEFVKSLKRQSISYLAACPTNKAAKNLRRLAENAGLDLDVKTVAQLLGQQPELNLDTGQEEFVSNGSTCFANHKVIIIDEFSMVSRENFVEIVRESNTYGTKIIFVGDAAQLPPVKELEPMAARYPMRNTQLAKIIRYDGDIARIAEAIRTNPVVPHFTTTADKTVVCLSEQEWLKKALSLFDTEEFAENSDHVRLLAWRNKTVEALNHAVRLHLWGEAVNPYVPGDMLIARKPLFRPKPGAKGKDKWRIFINNSEEATVSEQGVLTELKFNREIYQYWEVLIRSEIDRKESKLLILHADSKELHAQKVKEYAHKKQWSSYFDLSRMFDDVGYAYALTVHKAQGSTIDNVFLDVDDMMGCSDRQKLLYTALTRTKKQAFVLQLS